MKFLYTKADRTVGLVYVADYGHTPARIVGRDVSTHEPVHARWSAVTSSWVEVEPEVDKRDRVIAALLKVLDHEGLNDPILAGMLADAALATIERK